MVKRLSLVTVLFLLLFSTLHNAAAQPFTAPAIVTFTSDLTSITPDEAESGAKYAELTWQTKDLNNDNHVFLQVFVLNAWHDVRAEPFPATAKVNWAVAHTLDFAPPAFRLIIRDSRGKEVANAQLTIPYTTTIDPAKRPAVELHLPVTIIQIGNPLPVSWTATNRPARSNLRFIQHLNNGKEINVELPRSHEWVSSSGDGTVMPIADGNTITIGVQVFNIDTGEIYTSHLVTVPVGVSGPFPTDTPFPMTQSTPFPTLAPSTAKVLSFKANALEIKRGEALKVAWQTQQASDVALYVYDIDDHGSYAVPQPKQTYNKLASSGSLDLPSPADYPGSGWTVVLAATNPHEEAASSLLYILFSDVEQPIWLRLQEFSAGPAFVHHGETITISWQAEVQVRGLDTSTDLQTFTPTHRYDDKLVVDIRPMYPTGHTPDSPLAGHFEKQPMDGTLQWKVPDFDPAYNGLDVRISIPTAGNSNTYMDKQIFIVEPKDTSVSVQAAYQEYDNGFMIWNGSTGEIYAFMGTKEVETFLQSDYANLPDPMNLTPPAGHVKAINDFGKVWGNSDNLQTIMGWPVAPEQSYTMTQTYLAEQTLVLISLPGDRLVMQNGRTWTRQR